MTIRIALGAMMFGTRIDERTAFDLLDRYVDGGGAMIDTANCYAFWASETGFGGQSEELIGRWLARRPGMRDRVEISTKVGAEPTKVGGFPEFAEGLSASVIRSGLEGSLRRLGTDRVEMYWAHMEDRRTALTETVASFGQLVDEGKVGRLGASNHALWRVEQAHGIAKASGTNGFTALQLSYTYLRPRPWTRPAEESHRFGRVNDETLDYAVSNPGVDIWAYSPLLSGSYDRADRSFDQVFDHPGSTRRLAALTEVAAEHGVSRSQVVLAWLAGGSPSIVPIVGVSTAAQVEDGLAGARLELSADQRARLDSAN